jgi:hypothetical protein
MEGDVDVFDSVWLYASSLGREHSASYTLLVPKRNVFAHVALTVYTAAAHSDSDGAAAGIQVVRFSSFKPLLTGEIEVPEWLPPDWKYNSIYIEKCTSITFGLKVKNAWAYGCAVVFID